MFESLKHHIPKRIGEEKETSFAVLIPLIKKEDGYHVLFEVRAKHLNKQPGEVCFPGGKVEPGESTYEAAVRGDYGRIVCRKRDHSGLWGFGLSSDSVSDTHRTVPCGTP